MKYKVSIYLAIAIVNDDFTGLSDTEIVGVETFVNEAGYIPTFPACVPEFAVCEITGLWSDCVTIEPVKL